GRHRLYGLPGGGRGVLGPLGRSGRIGQGRDYFGVIEFHPHRSGPGHLGLEGPTSWGPLALPADDLLPDTVVMSLLRDDDLEFVRRQLDNLSRSRAMGDMTDSDRTRYRDLCVQ